MKIRFRLHNFFSPIFQDQRNKFVLDKRTLNGSLLKRDKSICCLIICVVNLLSACTGQDLWDVLLF